jgi:hypothetical protein
MTDLIHHSIHPRTPKRLAEYEARFWDADAPLRNAIGWNEIVTRSGHSASTLWRWRREGRFPFVPILSRSTDGKAEMYYDRPPLEKWLSAITGTWNEREAA